MLFLRAAFPAVAEQPMRDIIPPVILSVVVQLLVSPLLRFTIPNCCAILFLTIIFSTKRSSYGNCRLP
nr:MAG TPA: hypothetical protein [Caudoviricetes sp.]